MFKKTDEVEEIGRRKNMNGLKSTVFEINQMLSTLCDSQYKTLLRDSEKENEQLTDIISKIADK